MRIGVVWRTSNNGKSAKTFPDDQRASSTILRHRVVTPTAVQLVDAELARLAIYDAVRRNDD